MMLYSVYQYNADGESAVLRSSLSTTQMFPPNKCKLGDNHDVSAVEEMKRLRKLSNQNCMVLAIEWVPNSLVRLGTKRMNNTQKRRNAILGGGLLPIPIHRGEIYEVRAYCRLKLNDPKLDVNHQIQLHPLDTRKKTT